MTLESRFTFAKSNDCTTKLSSFTILAILLLMLVKSSIGIECFQCLDVNDDCSTSGQGKLVDCNSQEAQGWKQLFEKSLNITGTGISSNAIEKMSANSCQKN